MAIYLSTPSVAMPLAQRLPQDKAFRCAIVGSHFALILAGVKNTQ